MADPKATGTRLRRHDSGAHRTRTFSSLPPKQNWFTPGEVAEAVHMSYSTIAAWIADGKLKPDYTTLGGHARFSKASVEELRRRMLGAA